MVLICIYLVANDVEYFFPVLICHTCFLFDKIVAAAFHPFYNWIDCVFTIELETSLCIMAMRPLLNMWLILWACVPLKYMLKS